MTRQTSIEAYHEVMESGLVGQRQRQVYEILFRYGPLTANQTWNALRDKIGKDFRFDSNTRARFTELRNLGLLYEVGTTQDPITRKRVILWDVTDGRPRKPEPKITKDQIIADLRATIASLQRRLNGELL